jgi:copper chaperone CopZ
MMKRYLAAAFALALVFGAALVVAQADTEKEAAPAEVQRAVFKVDNLTCGACLSKINSALEPVDGFYGMGANLLRKRVAVDFTAPLAPENIGEIITNLGYPATLDSVDALTEKQTFAYMRSQRRGGGYGGSCCGGNQAAAQCPGTGCAVPPGSPKTGRDI